MADKAPPSGTGAPPGNYDTRTRAARFVQKLWIEQARPEQMNDLFARIWHEAVSEAKSSPQAPTEAKAAMPIAAPAPETSPHALPKGFDDESHVIWRARSKYPRASVRELMAYIDSAPALHAIVRYSMERELEKNPRRIEQKDRRVRNWMRKNGQPGCKLRDTSPDPSSTRH